MLRTLLAVSYLPSQLRDCIKTSFVSLWNYCTDTTRTNFVKPLRLKRGIIPTAMARPPMFTSSPRGGPGSRHYCCSSTAVQHLLVTRVELLSTLQPLLHPASKVVCVPGAILLLAVNTFPVEVWRDATHRGRRNAEAIDCRISRGGSTVSRVFARPFHALDSSAKTAFEHFNGQHHQQQ